jgi:hypothetical protein
LTAFPGYTRIVNGLNGKNMVYVWLEKVGKVMLTFSIWNTIFIQATFVTLFPFLKANRIFDMWYGLKFM